MFLYILEFHPQKVIFLPILAILWSNIHGVEFPVMLLILLAYILEFFIAHFKNRIHIQKNELAYILSLVISMGCVYLTPHGSQLMGVPLINTDFASQYINELRHLSLNDLLTFQLPIVFYSSTATFNILFALAIISAAKSMSQLRVRISHLLMLAGGIVLLTKATRFIYEFALLSLPILRAFPWQISFTRLKKQAKIIWSILVAVALVLPFLWLQDFFGNKPKFPFSESHLPQGVVTFLNHIPAGGSILNHPNKGGYLQWMVSPKYKIFMDMEVPFLFADEDFFMGHQAFANEEVLAKILRQYDPSFITAPIVSERFKGIIRKFPDFELVFFDHTEVLYLNKKHYPKIAEEYGIKDMDPFQLSSKSIDAALQTKRRESLLQDLERLLQIYPECLLKNQVMAMIYNKGGEYKKAAPYADAVIRNYPESPVGYRVKGDVLAGMKLYDEALSLYEMALRRLDKEGKRGVYKQIGFVNAEQKQNDQAYEALKTAIHPFAVETTYKDLCDLGAMAFSAGKTKEALTLLKFAEIKVPPEDTLWMEKIQRHLAMIRTEK
jgi:hypothetical protein